MLIGFVAAIALVGGRVKADIIMSEPTSVGPVINDAYDVQNSDFSHDGLQLYFAVWGRPGGFGSGDIYMAERETFNSPWQEPVNLGPNVNSSACEIEPSISSDGLELYFSSWDDYILRVCTRTSSDAPWSKPVKIGPPVGSNEPAIDIGSNDVWSPDISGDGLSLYFVSTRVGGYGRSDVWMTTRPAVEDPWGEPTNLGTNINSSDDECFVSISADGLILVFNRGFRTMWTTTRKSIDDDWGPAVMLPFENPPGNFHSPTFSPDGSTLYFNVASAWGTLGKNDIWQVNFIPIVDFNSDGIVDAADMGVMVDNWHTHSTLCDIAPLPLGDGYIDVKDLLVLAEYLEPGDPTLIAHWPLDETEGMVVADSTGNNDGYALGNPIWQPDGGQVDGALQLDGVDDCVITKYILNPADGPFSIFAWVKGGAPGQVVVSQMSGVNWLCIDSSEGVLTTELADPNSDIGPLRSQSVITDGVWHRIGFMWDGSHRTLYVDDVVVAEDEQANLEASENGLYIGTGTAMEPGCYWSGLIDDVRIYNRAVIP
jgi:hypothetical protein